MSAQAAQGLPSLTQSAPPWPWRPTHIPALLFCPDTAAALQDVFNETRSILEPAGAVAVAGAKAYLKHHNIQVRACIAPEKGFPDALYEVSLGATGRGSMSAGQRAPSAHPDSADLAPTACYQQQPAQRPSQHAAALRQGLAAPCELSRLTAHTEQCFMFVAAVSSPPHQCFLLLQGKTVVAVTSGANMNFDRLRLVSELADIGARREAMLAVTIPEQPGAFRAFVDAALGDTDIQVTEFKYRCGSRVGVAWVSKMHVAAVSGGVTCSMLRSLGPCWQEDLVHMLCDAEMELSAALSCRTAVVLPKPALACLHQQMVSQSHRKALPCAAGRVHRRGAPICCVVLLYGYAVDACVYCMTSQDP